MKYIFTIIFLLVYTGIATGQSPDRGGLRISLLTVGPGHEEIYEPFGHTGVRIVDTLNGTDLVYNYGSFNYNEPNFELRFMRGKLMYYLSVSSFGNFLAEYEYTGRGVEEQVLVLNTHQANHIQEFLQHNLLPENRHYKYDFYFDNCATRVRDIFPGALGAGFRFSEPLPEGHSLSFRRITNQYLYREHFARFGINLLLGSRVDKVMTGAEAMFLPDFLRDGLDGASAGGNKIAGPAVTILEGRPEPGSGFNGVLALTGGILLLTVAGLSITRLRRLGGIMEKLLLLLSGLLGWLMLLMWFGTDHQACQENLNVIWALPVNLLLLFRRKPADKYCILAIFLVCVSLLLHLMRIQELPLTELWPLLLSLLFVYGTIYKRSVKTRTATARS